MNHTLGIVVLTVLGGIPFLRGGNCANGTCRPTYSRPAVTWVQATPMVLENNVKPVATATVDNAVCDAKCPCNCDNCICGPGCKCEFEHPKTQVQTAVRYIYVPANNPQPRGLFWRLRR